jgi:NADH-quinone oxidoreductase subunit A
MNNWLLLPPIAFCLLLAVTALLAVILRPLAPRGADSVGKTKAYACGEDVVTNRVQPDYSQFFPYAFFFSVAHVVALILATVPAGGLKKFIGIAILYLLAALSGLFILFREKIQGDLAALIRR